MTSVSDWYQQSYRNLGRNAQRKYPNEELCRFVGRRFSHLSNEERSRLRVLEVGCGSGGNLRMLSEENFQVYGVDLSTEGLEVANSFIEQSGLHATLYASDMCDMSHYIDNSFIDVVVDVFSSNCLCHTDYLRFLAEVYRVLKSGGIYFCYTPSKRSDAYTNPGPSQFLDSYTLDGIRRLNSPFTGNIYPFRFMHKAEAENILSQASLYVDYIETVSRTYQRGEELFEFLVIEAQK